MEPGTVPKPNQVRFQWRWSPEEGQQHRDHDPESDTVVNFFEPSEEVVDAARSAGRQSRQDVNGGMID